MRSNYHNHNKKCIHLYQLTEVAIVNYHKLSGLKHHVLLSHNFCYSGVSAWLSCALCLESQSYSKGVGWAVFLSGVSSEEESDSKFSAIVSRIHFLVTGYYPKFLDGTHSS